MGNVLGLDIGTNSIGWAIIDDSANKIIDLGVRLFKEGVNNINQAKEQSKNATRSEKHQIRIQLQRKKSRKRLLLKHMKEFKIIDDGFEDIMMTIDPYIARRDAINGKIELERLARALFHICQHRGYKSNRKAGNKDEEKGALINGSKEGKITGIAELNSELEKGKFRTIGEYFASLNPQEKRIRARYTERKQYEYEFDLIWETQAKFYPYILNDEAKAVIRDKTIFFQRPLKSQKYKVGICCLEPKKRRAPKCSFEFQEFRMYQQINSLTISGEERIEGSLTVEDRQKLIDYLSNNTKLDLRADKKNPTKSFSKLKSVLKLRKDGIYKVNLETLGKLDGLKSLCSIEKALGKDFIHFDEKELNILLNTIYFATDNEWLIDYLQKRFNVSAEIAEKLADISLEANYGSLSKKAINKILPFLKEGRQYHDAAQDAGYDFAKVDEIIEKTDFVPEPERIANPIVMAGLYQTRKVVNEVIKRYGKPDTIRIEMARDLKMNHQQRMDILYNNKINEEINNEIRNKLHNEFGIKYVSRDDIIKYQLWLECKGECPYTGKTISLNQLFGNQPEFQIEHIIPYSRSLDDSYMNKTLCYIEENHNKGNKTPYEFYSHDKPKFHAISERIRKLPYKKAQRFLVKNLEEYYHIEGDDGFLKRQLNDTRYISRVAYKLMKHVCDDVSVSKGEITAILRRDWGLNSILKDHYHNNEPEVLEDENPCIDLQNENDEKTKDSKDKKDRGDHRHHAVDAIAIALASRSVVQSLSTYHGIYGNVPDQKEHKHPNHWSNFWYDVKDKVNSIIISNKVNTRVRGSLHDETYYGRIKDFSGEFAKDNKGLPMFTVRKPLESLTWNQFDNIINPVTKRAIIERMNSLDITRDKKNPNIPGICFKEPIFWQDRHGRRLPIKAVRIQIPSKTMINIRNYNIWAEPNNNHHVEIFADESGNIEGKTVSLFEAVKRKKNGESIITTDIAPNKEFVMALQKDEMIITGEIPKEFNPDDKNTYHLVFDQIYRVQKFDNSLFIVCRLHNVTSTNDKDNRGVLRKNPKTLLLYPTQARKIYIDTLGFIKLS